MTARAKLPPASTVARSKGETPYIMKYKTQPKLQMSMRWSMVHWEGTSYSSGALYGAVQCACTAKVWQ